MEKLTDKEKERVLETQTVIKVSTLKTCMDLLKCIELSDDLEINEREKQALLDITDRIDIISNKTVMRRHISTIQANKVTLESLGVIVEE